MGGSRTVQRASLSIKQKINEMINGKTRLIGLLGQPVDHSLSPVIHNAALIEMNLDWCYIALPCHAKSLVKVLSSLRDVNCQGLNITIPHKEKVLSMCDELSPIAQRVGAVNTLLPNPNGGWTGTNTDVAGFVAALKQKRWDGSHALILGCGGSARAVVAGLQDLNFQEICVVGRKEISLKNFLQDLKSNNCRNTNTSTAIKGLLTEDKQISHQISKADLIVNTTPVGMTRNTNNSSHLAEIPLGPEAWKNLKPKTILYDLIYTPRPTAWLSLGITHGCKTIDGLEMLINQGAASLKLWSGIQEIPINLMRIAAEKHLLV